MRKRIRPEPNTTRDATIPISSTTLPKIGENKPTINAEDIKFFLDWAKEAAGQNIAPDPKERALFDQYSEETIAFWEKLYRSVK